MTTVLKEKIPVANTATKKRLLDVAARLFAERGFDAVSLRLITTEAEANLAAVNYHFGSKEELIVAVVEQLVGPVNRRRIELLENAELTSWVGAQEIVESFIGPVFEAAARDHEDDQRFCKLMSRCIASRDERITGLVLRQFPEVLAKFVAAVRKCFPAVSSDTAHLRVMFMAGAMAHSLFHHDKLVMVSEGRCEVPSLEKLHEELVLFLSSGLSACEGTGDG